MFRKIVAVTVINLTVCKCVFTTEHMRENHVVVNKTASKLCYCSIVCVHIHKHITQLSTVDNTCHLYLTRTNQFAKFISCCYQS